MSNPKLEPEVCPNIDKTVFKDHLETTRKWMKELDNSFSSMSNDDLDVYLSSQEEVVRDELSQVSKGLLDLSKVSEFEYEHLNAATVAFVLACAVSLNIPITKFKKAPLPLIAENTLIFLLPRKNREEVMGCLEEDYVTNIVPKLGEKLARRWYWWQTIRTIWRYNGLTAWILNLVEEFKKSNSS